MDPSTADYLMADLSYSLEYHNHQAHMGTIMPLIIAANTQAAPHERKTLMTSPHNHLYSRLSAEKAQGLSSNSPLGSFSSAAMTLTLKSEDGKHQQDVTVNFEISTPSSNRALAQLLGKSDWVADDNPTGTRPAIAQRVPTSSTSAIMSELLQTMTSHMAQAITFYNQARQIHHLSMAAHFVLWETLDSADLVPSERLHDLIDYLETPLDERQEAFADFTPEQTATLVARAQNHLEQAQLPFTLKESRFLKDTLARIKHLNIRTGSYIGAVNIRLERVDNQEATEQFYEPMQEFTIHARSRLTITDTRVHYKVNISAGNCIMSIIKSHLGDENCPTELTNINLVGTSYANGHASGLCLEDKERNSQLTLDNCHFRGVDITNHHFPDPYITGRTLVDPYYTEARDEGEGDYIQPRFLYDERTALVQMDLSTGNRQTMTLSLLKNPGHHPALKDIPWVVAGCWHGSLDAFEAMIASDDWPTTPKEKTHLHRPAIEAQLKALRILANSWLKSGV